MGKISLSPPKLIYWQMILSMLVKLPAQVIPALGVLEYLVDAINVVLLVYLLMRMMQRGKLHRKSRSTVPVLMIAAMLLFDVGRAVIGRTNVILFLWGVRNQYRFLLLFLAVCEFWSIEDIERFFQICYRILIFNVFVITVQFVLGYGRDYLGGTFGLEKNVNAVANIFLCMMVTYGILGNMYKKVSLKRALIILLISVYWAALAELKFFFVELVIIFALLFFMIKGKSMSKMKWAFSLILFLGIGVVALALAFPEQVEYLTNISRFLWYAQNVQGGIYGFGRFTALGMITSIFFNNDLVSKIIGIGVGNAEFMNIGGRLIASPFYNQYRDYMYMGYFHSMVYIERGVLGLIWYAVFWLLSFSKSIKMKKKSNNRMMAEFSIPLLICVAMLAVKDSTLRVSISGYLVSIIVAIPYVIHSGMHGEAVIGEPEAVQAPPAKRRSGLRFVWKPPIWLDEDDGKATGVREENVSFAVFDTLIRRSVARPADLFRIMEQNDPLVPEHFAEKRMEAERAAFAKRGARMGLADIYEELLPLYGSRTNDLMALEIQYEIAGCRPVADNIDLVNLCMEHDKNVFLLADTYLPSSVLRRMLDVCGVYHYDRLYVSCEEGACKADGSLFWKVLADQEIRPHELRHIGSDRQGDITEPWRVGVHVKRGKKKDLSAVDKDLPEDVALYERTLQTCVRNCADDLDSGDARLGCETFGPLLAGFTAWLREQLCRDGIQDVYFLAGDGAVLKQAFDALEDGSFRTYSLYFPAQTADQDHEALLAYIRACGMQGKVALVDTGQAAVQKMLEQLIAEAGLAIQVKGYYVGLNPDTEGLQAAGYLYERGQGAEILEKLSPITVLFDTIFHAQHGPVRRIVMRDGQPVPELDAYEYASYEGRICDEIAILRAYQAGALTLVQEMNGAFPGGVPQIPGEAALLPLLRMGTNPTRQEAELWGDFRVFRDGKATMMARPKGMGTYLLHPGRLKRDYAASPWKIGFLRRISRLPLSYDKIVKNR